VTPATVHTLPTRNRQNDHTRLTERRPVALPARLMWRDQRGTERFASVVDRISGWLLQFVRERDPTSVEVGPENPDSAGDEANSPEIADLAGVTSNAGFSICTPSGTICFPAMCVTSFELRCSMGILLPSGVSRSTVEIGAAT